MRYFILILFFTSFKVSAQVKVDPYVSNDKKTNEHRTYSADNCDDVFRYGDGFYRYKGKDYNLGAYYNFCDAKEKIIEIIEKKENKERLKVKKQNELRRNKAKKLDKQYLNCLMKNIKANSTEAHKNVIELFCKDKVYN